MKSWIKKHDCIAASLLALLEKRFVFLMGIVFWSLKIGNLFHLLPCPPNGGKNGAILLNTVDLYVTLNRDASSRKLGTHTYKPRQLAARSFI